MEFLIKEHVLPCQHVREYARATALEQEAVLNLAIKQYIPIDNPSPQPGDVTIIGASANGFPKVSTSELDRFHLDTDRTRSFTNLYGKRSKPAQQEIASVSGAFG
jgi:hypothetical protein